MIKLTINMLGAVQVLVGGEEVNFRSDKERALLCYLALESDRAHTREFLADLLWPTQKAAKGNFRVTFHRLRTALSDSDESHYFEIHNHTVQFKSEVAQLDTDVFTAHLGYGNSHKHVHIDLCDICREHFLESAKQFRGDLLQDVYLSDSLAFMEWLSLKQEKFRRQMLNILYKLTDDAHRHGRLEVAQKYARRQVELEPWREEAHQQLMKILACQQEYSAALEQYRSCCKILNTELGIASSAATEALFERIKTIRDTPPQSLPHLSSFIGRTEEQLKISQFLSSSVENLLTILGPGGVGKTKLTIAVGNINKDRFLEGCAFVPLGDVPSSTLIMEAIANALNIPISGQVEPAERIVEYLSPKEMLLILDNFDHLLDGAYQLNALQQLPNIKIIVTSRERLGLLNESLYELQGLSWPQETENDLDEVITWDAVRLFQTVALRHYADFCLTDDNQKDVFRICQLVEGMPLAIELAAAWTRYFSCSQIRMEIEKNLRFLSIPKQNSEKDRHQSIHATFEYSWQSLTVEEQKALQRVTVFRGGFQLEAAVIIAEVDNFMLSRLIDKSLLRYNNDGQYTMHPLIQQYGMEKLVTNKAEYLQTRGRHTEYYVEYLCERDLRSGNQSINQKILLQEIENIRLAWNDILVKKEVDLFRKICQALHNIYELTGWFREGYRIFSCTGTIPSFEANSFPFPLEMYIPMLTHQAWFAYRLGKVNEGALLAEFCLSLMDKVTQSSLLEKAFVLITLGFCNWIRGKYQQAKSNLELGLMISRELQDFFFMVHALDGLALLTYDMGDLISSQEYLQESSELSQKNGDLRGVNSVEFLIGRNHIYWGNYEDAAQSLKKSQQYLEKTIDDKFGTAFVLFLWGQLYHKQKKYLQAQEYYEQALQMVQNVGENWLRGNILNHLGINISALKDYHNALPAFYRALQLGYEYNILPLVLETLTLLEHVR